ncbi:hypothetical protein [Amycolatopsis sp. NPDC004378]
MRTVRRTMATGMAALAMTALVTPTARADDFSCELAGVALQPGQTVAACDGAGYRLQLQADGNLVLRNSAGDALWATGTGGKGVTRAEMQGDGNLVVYAGSQAVYDTGTGGFTGAQLRVQNDGNLVIYCEGYAVWSRYLGFTNELQVFRQLPYTEGQYRVVESYRDQPTDGNDPDEPLDQYVPTGAKAGDFVKVSDGQGHVSFYTVLTKYDASQIVEGALYGASQGALAGGLTAGLKDENTVSVPALIGGLVGFFVGTIIGGAKFVLKTDMILVPGKINGPITGSYNQRIIPAKGYYVPGDRVYPVPVFRNK